MWMEVVSEHIYGHIIDHVLVFVFLFFMKTYYSLLITRLVVVLSYFDDV